jgi:PilZ domain
MLSPNSRANARNRDARRAMRLDVAFDAGLREPGSSKFQISVVDLSVTGFRCETSFSLREGSTVWLTIPGLAGIEAIVAWKDQFHYGCSFKAPLHIAVFDHIARLHPPSSAR